MKKKKLSLIVIALAMMISTTVFADTIIWEDNFDNSTTAILGYGASRPVEIKASNSPYRFNERWNINIPNGFSSYGSSYQMANGKMKLYHRWGSATRMAITEPSEAINLPENWEMSFRIQSLPYYDGVNSSYTQTSTIFSRFAVSEDRKSYYEIGLTGYNTSISRYVINGLAGDDAVCRLYFRKVVNGTQTDLIVDDGTTHGLAASTDGKSDSKYRRWSAAAEEKEKMIKVIVRKDGNTISWRCIGQSALDCAFEWKGNYTDNSVMNIAVPIQFGAAGHEQGVAVDDVVIKEIEAESQPASVPTMSIRDVNSYYVLSFSNASLFNTNDATAVAATYVGDRLISIQTRKFNPKTTSTNILLKKVASTIGAVTKIGVFDENMQMLLPMSIIDEW